MMGASFAQRSAPLQMVADAAKRSGFDIYAVGGAVRNQLLGYTEKDTDLCGPQTAEEMRVIASSNITVTDAVNGLGTALILCGGEHFEYTAFRTDSYAPGGSHTPDRVQFTTDIAVDARRRDFTVNALYMDLASGRILDPLGTGRADLKRRILRQVRSETMDEDALRILRMVRFAAQLGFTVDEETFAAARLRVPGLKDISGDRIRDELYLMLLSDVPYGRPGAPAKALLMLRDLGALDYVLPGLMDGAGFAQNEKYHRYDVLEHQIAACAAAPPDLRTRLAALLHDIAKPAVFRKNGNMHEHPKEGAEQTRRLLKRLNASSGIICDTSQLVAEHMFDLANTAKPKAIRRHILKMGPEQYERLADLREADFAGSGRGSIPKSADKWRTVLAEMKTQNAPFQMSDLAVNGTDIMRELGLEPGPQVGTILRALLPYAAERPSRNNYNCLLNYARMLKDRAPGVPGRPQSDSDGGPKSV